jgi:hypothetical protein
MNIKALFVSTIFFTLTIPVIAKQAIALDIDKSVPCYFFKGENLAVKDICKVNGFAGEAGQFFAMKWSDGVITSISSGYAQGRPLPCSQEEIVSVDGICGETYLRSPKNLKRLAELTDGDYVECVQLGKKSVCFEPTWRLGWSNR